MSVAAGLLIGYYAAFDPQVFVRLQRHWPWAGLIGSAFLAYNYFGFMKGVELTTASNAQIMIQTGPLLLLLIGVFYFKEHLRSIQWVGVASAAAGFVLFYHDQVRMNLTGQTNYFCGLAWILSGAVAWAIFASLQKSLLRKGWRPGELNLLTYFVCALLLAGPADFNDFRQFDLKKFLIVIFLGLNTVVAYGAFAEAMSLIPASQVSLIITANPLLTIFLVQLLSQFNFNIIPPEPMGARGLAGALLVVAGIAVAVGTPLLWRARRRTRPRV